MLVTHHSVDQFCSIYIWQTCNKRMLINRCTLIESCWSIDWIKIEQHWSRLNNIDQHLQCVIDNNQPLINFDQLWLTLINLKCLQCTTLSIHRHTHLPTCCHGIDTTTGGTSVYLFRSHPKDLWPTATYLLQVVSQESLPQLFSSQGWAGDFWPAQESNLGPLAW